MEIRTPQKSKNGHYFEGVRVTNPYHHFWDPCQFSGMYSNGEFSLLTAFIHRSMAAAAVARIDDYDEVRSVSCPSGWFQVPFGKLT